jgi:type II secretory pathway pseudopilin PulG
VELLVVVAIAVLLLGVAVPMMKMPLQENRIREASRQINVFAAQAQARAREIRRPVAIWIERAAAATNVANNLYLAETPPPYAGDLFGAKAVVYYDWQTDLRWEIDFFDGLSGSITAATATALIKAGEQFRIRFGYRGPIYSAMRDATSGQFFLQLSNPTTWEPPRGFWGPRDGHWGDSGDDNANGTINDVAEAGWDYAQFPNRYNPTDTDYGLRRDERIGLPYQIYLNPRRSSDAPLQLPTGIVVDLSYSGLGIDFPPKLASTATQRIRGLEFGGLWTSDANGGYFTAAANPVLITIGPDGSVQWVEYEGIRAEPTSSVHLLIGRVDRAVNQDNTPVTPNPIPWSLADPNKPFAYDQNLADPSAIWVSIGCRSGSVTSSENGWALGGNPVNFLDSVTLSREFAQSARPMVGR